MFVLYYIDGIWQSIKDTWLPILIPFGILILIFLFIAVIRERNKD